MANASVRITANTSDYRKQMREVTQQMKQVSQEYSLASQKAKLLGNAKDQLKAKAQQLTQKIEAQKQKIQINSEYTSRLSKDSETLKTKQEQLKSKIADVEAAYKQSIQATGKESEESKKLANELEQLKTDLNNNERALQDTENRLESTQRATQNATGQLELLEIELEQINEEINNFDLNQLAEGLQSTGGKIESIGQKFLGISTAVGGAVTVSVKSAADFESSMTRLQNQTGATESEMQELEGIMRDIYSNNLGDSMDDVAASLAEVKNQTGLTGEALQSMTEKALLVKEAFGFEVNESIRSVNMMIKQFGISSDEAFNLLAQGAQAGLDKNGDLLDTINEYSVHFKQLGFDSDEMFNMLVNGAESGTFSVDKLGDAVKEFGIRAKDGSDSSAKAFKDLGFNSDEMFKKFAQGGTTAEKATIDVITKLFSMDDKVKQNEIGVALFGTMWEDLGANGVKALMNVNGEIDKTSNSLDSINQNRTETLTNSIETLKRTLIDAGISIGTAFLPTLRSLTEKIQGAVDKFNSFDQETQQTIVKVGLFAAAIGPTLIGVGKFVSTIGKAIKAYKKFKEVMTGLSIMTKLSGAITAVKGAFASFGAVLMANPIILVVAAVAALTAGLVYLWNTNEGFRNAVIGIWENIKSTVVGICENIKNTAINAWNGLTQTVSNVFNTVKNIIQVAFMFIANLIKFQVQILLVPWMFIWNNFKDKLIEIWNNIKTAIVSKAQELIAPIVEKFNNIKLRVEKIVTILKNKVTLRILELKQQFIEKVQSIINPVVQKFESIKTKVQSKVNSLKEKTISTINSLKSKMISIAGSIVSPFVQKFNSIKDKVSSTIEKLKSTVKNGLDKVKGFFNSCKLKLPDIKMPHISVSGKFSINPPSAPSFKIKWYAKGGIMNNPVIFGMAGNTFLGGGEAGQEAILPLTQFYNRLNYMLDRKLAAISNINNIQVIVYNELDGDDIASKTTTKVVKNISRENKNNKIKKGK